MAHSEAICINANNTAIGRRAILRIMINVSKYPQTDAATRRFKGIRAFLAFLVALVVLTFAPSSQAFAEDTILYSSQYSTYGIPLTTMSQIRSEPVVDRLFTYHQAIERGDVFVVVAPGWEWDDIKEDTTPTLYNFVYANASANLVYNAAMDWNTHAWMPSFHMMAFSRVSTSEMEEIMVRVVNNLKTGDSLIITNSVAFLGEYDASEDYSCFVMKDASDKGLLTSDVTQHMGLISTRDAINAIDALAASSQRFPGNLTVYPTTDLMPTITRLNILTRDSAMATALQASQPTFIVMVVACLLIAMLLTVVLLFLEIRIRPAILSYLLPAARIMWIVSLSLPLASYLMMLLLPIHCDPEICLDYFWSTAMQISLVCMVVALVFRWSWAYMALLGATVLTLVIDQLAGGPLSIGSYLSYAPVEGVRFFGIGNEGAALLYGAWIMLIAFYLTRRSETKLASRLRRWLFPLASLFIIAVIAAPWWGANFGIIIWGSVGTFLAWRLLNGHRFSKREVTAAVLVSGLMAIAVLFLDTTFNSGSHMGGSVDFSKGDILEQIVQVFVNVAIYCWDTLVFAPVLTVLFVCIVLFLLFIVVAKPGPYAAFWRSHKEFQGAFYALIVTAILMFLFEDSGILMPALMLLYPLSGLMWFVCNFHSWHIRSFIKERQILER